MKPFKWTSLIKWISLIVGLANFFVAGLCLGVFVETGSSNLLFLTFFNLFMGIINLGLSRFWWYLEYGK